MTEFIEIIENNPNTQKEIKQNFKKYSNYCQKTESQRRQNRIIQTRIYENTFILRNH